MKESLPFLGHRNNYTALLEMFSAGRLPHALLFVGPEGIGKLKAARHLSRAILCENAPGPCEQCQSCKLTAEEKHPDLIWNEPEGGRHKIDLVRAIKKELAFPPMMGSTRVVAFNDAHTLTTSAANALLKSLEEPTAGTYFIMVTHALGWVPRTIVSRSHKALFAPLSPEHIKEILEESGRPHSPELIRRSQGSALQAMRLGEVEGETPPLEKLLPGPHAVNFHEAFELCQEVIAADRIPAFLHSLLSSAHQSLTEDRDHRRHEFDLLNFADRILEIRNLFRQNINPKIHLTRLLLYFQEAPESRL